jgi:nucleoid DNA-binding protein
MRIEEKDISYLVAKETGLSKEHVEFIISNFWSAIREYLSNPLDCKLGIKLVGFGVFRLRTKAVRYVYENKRYRKRKHEVLTALYNKFWNTDK